MAFDLLNQMQTVRALTPELLQDVMRITVRTQGHGVIFTQEFPLGEWTTGIYGATLLTTVGAVEALFTIPGVWGVSFSEDIDANGLIVGMLDIIVSPDQGFNTAIIRIALADVNDQSLFAQRIADALAKLEQSTAV